MATTQTPNTITAEHHPVALLTDHPLPLSEAGAEQLWESNEHLQEEYETPPHPDTLHEQFLTTIASTDEWDMFTISLYGFSYRIYIWNHLAGFGFSIDTFEDDHKQIKQLFENWTNNTN